MISRSVFFFLLLLCQQSLAIGHWRRLGVHFLGCWLQLRNRATTTLPAQRDTETAIRHRRGVKSTGSNKPSKTLLGRSQPALGSVQQQINHSGLPNIYTCWYCALAVLFLLSTAAALFFGFFLSSPKLTIRCALALRGKSPRGLRFPGCRRAKLFQD